MKQPNTLAFAGRILFALPLLVFGAMHFAAAPMLAPRVPFPPQVVWVYVTGAALLAAGVSVIIKRHTVLALLGLAAMLLVFDLTHALSAGRDGSR